MKGIRDEKLKRALERGIVMLLLVVSSLVAVTTAQAATQLVVGNPIRISVADNGSPAISVKHPTTGVYTIQYFYGIDAPSADWGSVIWLAGTDTNYKYAMHSGIGGVPLTPISNITTVDGATSTITTVVDLGSTGIRVTQKFIYTEGDRFVSKEWYLANTGGTTYNDLRFFHGGDSFFGGEDSAYSFYDAANSMVYLRNDNYTDWGIMGFYANPATPASHYYSGQYGNGLTQAGTNALLNDTVDGSYRDAGYQLQWNRALLAPGDTWTILASEVWSLPGAIQVIAPVGQNVSAGGTAELSFTVQNLAAAQVNVTLSASDTAGWGAVIQGSTTATIAANGNISVPVRVSVAGGATAGQTSSVTLTADDGITPKSVSALLTVVSVNLNLSSDPVAFGSIITGNSTSQTVTITNSGATAVTFGNVGGSNPLAAPFGISSDTCSGATVAASATCSFDISFNPGSSGVYNDSLDIPILDPIIVSRTLTVSGTGASLAPAGPHIVWRNATTGQDSVWTMDGTTFKSSAFINSAPAPWKVVGIGDLDGDGSPDIVWRNATTGQNSVWFMNGAAFRSTSSLTTVAAPWTVVGVGDLNGDGKADIIWRNPTTGQNSAWIMNGATITSSAYLNSAPAPWTVVGVGDLNADNKADIIWRNPTTGQNSAWIMNGTTVSSSVYLNTAPAAWTVVGVGDLNGDGKADIIWRNATTGQNSVWLMNGTTVTSSVFLTTLAAPWTVAGVADFNGDGKADILWRNPTTGQNTVWIMNGATTTTTVPLNNAPAAWSIVGVLKVPQV